MIGIRPSYSEPGDVPAPSGVYVVFGRILSMVWLVFLAYPINDLLRSAPAKTDLIPALSGVAMFVGIYLWIMLRNPFSLAPASTYKERAPHVALCLLLVLAVALNVFYGEAGRWLGLFIFVSAAAGMVLAARIAVGAIVATTILTVALGFVAGLGLAHAGLYGAQVLGIGLGLVGWARTTATITELRSARRELARLAVAEERLRFARDLHDLLGHSLSLITLKSELAGRLIESAPQKATAEISDVERVARRALREVREAVAGYRQISLRTELEGARQMLEAAGIDCRVDSASGELSAFVDAVLAWAVREGTTNVIRHSRARSCYLTIRSSEEEVVAEVVDDGRGVSPSSEAAGSGLSGLSERVASHGGSMDAGPRSQGGFRLRVKLPLVGTVEAGGEANVPGAAVVRGRAS